MKCVQQYVNIIKVTMTMTYDYDYEHRSAVSKVQGIVPGGSRLVTVTKFRAGYWAEAG